MKIKSRVYAQKAVNNHWLKLLFLCLLIIVFSGCQSTQGITHTPVPTSTPVPVTPEATPVPPTETPLPTATVIPEIQELYDIPYIDDDNDKHLLDLFLPPASDSSRPTIFALGTLKITSQENLELHNVGRKKLRDFARHFANLGYPVVIIDYTYPSEPYAEQSAKDAFCALSWVHANAETYNFDPERIVAYGHVADAAIAAKLGIVDDPTDYLEECPHPAPAHNLASIITYGGVFFNPAESLLSPGFFCKSWMHGHLLEEEMTLDDVITLFTQLSEIPPQEWRTDPTLDEQSRKRAALLPIYQLDGSEPNFLLFAGEVNIHERTVRTGYANNSPPQSDRFMEQLLAVGVDVQLNRIDNLDDHYFLLRESERMEPVFEAIEEYLSDRFP